MNALINKLLLTCGCVFVGATPGLAMTAEELAEWAKDGGAGYPGVEIHQQYDRACLQTYPLEMIYFQDSKNGKVRGITRYVACYGATLIEFEMRKGNPQSLRVVSAVGAGRSMQYANWTPLEKSDLDLSAAELEAIAEALETTEEEF